MPYDVPLQTLKRLPYFLKVLEYYSKNGYQNISSRKIAEELELTEIQVRKDLAAISKGGRPKIGYRINDLIIDVRTALGYGNSVNAVIVGYGNLGTALLNYKGFEEYGINIIAAFDRNKSKQKKLESGKTQLQQEKEKLLLEIKNAQ